MKLDQRGYRRTASFATAMLAIAGIIGCGSTVTTPGAGTGGGGDDAAAKLDAACAAVCETNANVSGMLGCSPLSMCVDGCVALGQAHPECSADYLKFTSCAAEEETAANCSCIEPTKQLGCMACSKEIAAWIACSNP